MPPKWGHKENITFIYCTVQCSGLFKLWKSVVIRFKNIDRRHDHGCTLQKFFAMELFGDWIVVKGSFLNMCFIEFCVFMWLINEQFFLSTDLKKNEKKIQSLTMAEAKWRPKACLQTWFVSLLGVVNGALKFLLLAKFKRVLACSCSPNFCIAHKLAKQIFYFCSCSQKNCCSRHARECSQRPFVTPSFVCHTCVYALKKTDERMQVELFAIIFRS